MKSKENELFLKRLNRLKEFMEDEGKVPVIHRGILMSRLNGIKEYLEHEEELGLTLNWDLQIGAPFDLKKRE